MRSGNLKALRASAGRIGGNTETFILEMAKEVETYLSKRKP